MGTHVNADWEQTGLERSTCDRITQDGFQKQVEAETSKASLQKTDLSVVISFCSLMKMWSTILTASSLTEFRQHPTGDDDDDAVQRQTVGSRQTCHYRTERHLKQLLLCLERSAVLLSM